VGTPNCIPFRSHPEKCFHSISFPSEWGPGQERQVKLLWQRFHSISFPSEWGREVTIKGVAVATLVSIQLVSPASGDVPFLKAVMPFFPVSIQLVSPASGDLQGPCCIPCRCGPVSIQLVSPASGDQQPGRPHGPCVGKFPFN